jgi:hypothetical protein
METLREARCLFTRLLAQLLFEADRRGYGVALNEVYRDARIAELNRQAGKGIQNSLHLIGLAADLNLYQGDLYLAKSEDHAALGAYWKALHPLCRWGGDFTKPDGNHYSLTWGGRA